MNWTLVKNILLSMTVPTVVAVASTYPFSI